MFEITPIADAATNVYYSVGQSSSNLMTGSPLVTIASGTATFSVGQTENIGVGDQVTYGSGSLAYISGKASSTDTIWTLVTATGTTPANISNAAVTSVNRAYASLSAAIAGFTDNNHLATTSLVGANAIVNLPCYYDTGADTSSVTINSSILTSSSTYLNIYTPNNTSTQANFSQRHTGVWTSNAYQMSVTNGTALNIQASYVRITGLQFVVIITASSGYDRAIDLSNLPSSTTATSSAIVIDSNIIRFQASTTPNGIDGIANYDSNGASPSVYVLNNIVYGATSSVATGIGVTGGHTYIYNDTVYNFYNSYHASNTGTTVVWANDIAQNDTVGFGTNCCAVYASSTNDISDHNDVPGSNGTASTTLTFRNAAGRDLHLSISDTSAIGHGANLYADPYYPFNYDIDGFTRPSSGAWDVGAAQYVNSPTSPPIITSFTMPTSTISTSTTVSVTSFVANPTAYPVVEYLITQSSSTPSSSNPNWATSTPTIFTFSGSGASTAYAWAMDTAGNISSSTSQTVSVTVDTTPPVITSFSMPATATSVVVPVSSFSATDTLVSVTGYLITTSSSTPSSTNPNWSSVPPSTFTFSGPGVQTAFAWAKDSLGNISSSTGQTVTVAAPGVWYSVGQSTSTNLAIGSSTLTITAGTAVFSVPQTGNIGVGDAVTYGSSSTVAYISGKSATDDQHWTLVTATGSIPANVSNAAVASIHRAFASLASAISGFPGPNYLATSSLVGADVVVNLPCYYDIGPDTSLVVIPSSTITGPANYLNIFTPNNTSTQVNLSQRDTGQWTANAYQLDVTNTTAIDVRASYVRVVGLQILGTETATSTSVGGIDLQFLPASVATTTSDIVADGNILHFAMASGSVVFYGIYSFDNYLAAPTVNYLNNVVYATGVFSTSSYGIFALGGTAAIYNNTVYGANTSYGTTNNTYVYFKNNIAQADTAGYYVGCCAVVDSSSADNISDQDDAPGNLPLDLATVFFVSTSTGDFHLGSVNPVAIDQGVNLSSDPVYPFNYDISGQSRPYGAGWDIGAEEWQGVVQSASPPTITSFVMPSSANSPVVTVSSFTANASAYPIAAYLITGSSAIPSVTNPDWNPSPPTSFTFSGVGVQTAYAWVMDAFGNISAADTAQVAVNSTFTTVPSGSGLPDAFFSMHWLTVADIPTIPFGGMRLLNTAGTSWAEIETASGTYNWTMLDQWLTAASSSGVDVLYAFTRTPQWASSNPSQSCAYGNNGCAAPPSDIGTGDYIWKNFVTALVEHSLASPTAHIKYYEIWNEPDSNATWSGTQAQLVTMATDAYSIIHTLDPNAVVVGPGISTSVSWLQGYYAAGGSAAQDVVGFHAYQSTTDPRSILSLTNSIRSLMNQYGIGNEALWYTEGSWGPGTTLTSNQQVAYLSQEYLYMWSQAIARYYWYAWDEQVWGTLWSPGTGIRPVGTAYGLLDNWLEGSTNPSSPCAEDLDALTWKCSLTLANGDPAEIAWNMRGTEVLSVNSLFTNYETLTNSNVNTITNNSVQIGTAPVLLFASTPPQSTSSGVGGGIIETGGSSGGGYTYPASTTSPVSKSTASTSSSTSTTIMGPTSTAAQEALLATLESEFHALLGQAANKGITIQDITGNSAPYLFTRNLTIGMEGSDVMALQRYLNTHGFPVASIPGHAGSMGYETQYFGVATKAALAKLQKNVGITPSIGYLGPITRAYVNSH